MMAVSARRKSSKLRTLDSSLYPFHVHIPYILTRVSEEIPPESPLFGVILLMLQWRPHSPAPSADGLMSLHLSFADVQLIYFAIIKKKKIK